MLKVSLLCTNKLSTNSVQFLICSQHNRNRFAADLESVRGELRCKRGVECILENSKGGNYCSYHHNIRHPANLMQRGETMFCNGFLRCDKEYIKCVKHGKLRLKAHLHDEKDIGPTCTESTSCEKRFLCDIHKQYRHAWHLLKFKSNYACRHDSRCKAPSAKYNTVQVGTFVLMDEIWGVGHDHIVHRVEGVSHIPKSVSSEINKLNGRNRIPSFKKIQRDSARGTFEWVK